MNYPADPNDPAEPTDIRLIVSDMDGTLLDDDGRVPDAFWPLLDALRRAGIVFVPASGRQYQTLHTIFGEHEGLIYIAENGTNVVQNGISIDQEPVEPAIIAPSWTGCAAPPPREPTSGSSSAVQEAPTSSAVTSNS